MGRRCARQWVVVALAVAVGVLGMVSGVRAFQKVEDGSAIPEFSLAGVDGGEVAISGGGQTMVLAFVRQGQKKSAEALGALQKLSEVYGDQIAVVAVVANPDDGDAAAWVKGAGAAYPVLLDSAGEVYGLYGVRVMPATGVINADGKLVGGVDGFTRRYKDEVDHLILVALGKAPEEKSAEKAEPEVAKSDERKAAERSLEKARLLRKRKMGSKAIAGAQAAVAADGEYLEARMLLGELLLEEGDEKGAEALPHFEKALELDPKNMDAKVGVARVKAIQGDTEGAVSLLQQAAMLNPKPERVYFELGRIHERAGDYQKAVEAYRKALERLLR